MSPLSHLFSLASGAFHELHDLAWLSSRSATIPVLSVGNLVAGGTGKTVLVDWLLRTLADKGTPGVACRGYRADASGSNDEMKVLSQLHPGLLIEADPERHRAVSQLAKRGCTFALLDDGFQHRRLKRDLDWVILDATDPFSSNLLPQGLRREAIDHLTRANLIWLSHADRLDPTQREHLRRNVQGIAGCPVITACHRMTQPTNAAGETLPPQPVHLVAGVGQPRHVVAGLEDLGYEIAERTLPGDHLSPSPESLQKLQKTPWPVVCTLKDAVKIPQSVSWWTVGVEWQPMEYCDAARQQIDCMLAQ